MNWTVQIADGLHELRRNLLEQVTATYSQLEAHLFPDVAMPSVNVSLTAGQAVIPELGIGGSALVRGAIDVVLDPTNANLKRSLDVGQLARTLCHEFHHCLRHESIGYGRTLGEALVSEGLADQFDRELNGGSGQIWDNALSDQQWRMLLPRVEEALLRPQYDHASWFFGRLDGTVPRWTGYSVGYHLVGEYLTDHPLERPSRMGATSATQVLRTAWPKLRASMGWLN
jgi:uncharacterized protein YjaZ